MPIYNTGKDTAKLKEQNDKAVLLMSGGPDAALALKMAISEGFEVHCLFFSYGQIALDAELEASRALCESMGAASFKVMNVDGIAGNSLVDTDIASHKLVDHEMSPSSYYVPFRNGWMLSMGAGYAEAIGAGSVWIGTLHEQEGPPVPPDCRRPFLAAMEEAIYHGSVEGDIKGVGLRIVAPLVGYTSKVDAYSAGEALGIAPEEWEATVSCYHANKEGQACGQCFKCQTRRTVFLDIFDQDYTRYQ